jgi:hypothetical protein
VYAGEPGSADATKISWRSALLACYAADVEEDAEMGPDGLYLCAADN